MLQSFPLVRLAALDLDGTLLTEENKSVCSSHTAILEALLHGSADDVSEALESHLSRYKQSVAQARSVHPEYFIDE